MKLLWLKWFEENSQAEPKVTLQAAALRYQEKYAVISNRARIPHSCPEAIGFDDITIESDSNILPRHIHLTFDPALQRKV
jgi:hypothetical protein